MYKYLFLWIVATQLNHWYNKPQIWTCPCHWVVRPYVLQPCDPGSNLGTNIQILTCGQGIQGATCILVSGGNLYLVQTCQLDTSFVGLGQSEHGPGRISCATHHEMQKHQTQRNTIKQNIYRNNPVPVSIGWPSNIDQHKFWVWQNYD